MTYSSEESTQGQIPVAHTWLLWSFLDGESILQNRTLGLKKKIADKNAEGTCGVEIVIWTGG